VKKEKREKKGVSEKRVRERRKKKSVKRGKKSVCERVKKKEKG
jgi:hypothetical protein